MSVTSENQSARHSYAIHEQPLCRGERKSRPSGFSLQQLPDSIDDTPKDCLKRSMFHGMCDCMGTTSRSDDWGIP